MLAGERALSRPGKRSLRSPDRQRSSAFSLGYGHFRDCFSSDSERSSGNASDTMPIRFTTAGESHGPGLVSILEGMPAGLPLLAEHVDTELARRQQGYGRGRRM